MMIFTARHATQHGFHKPDRLQTRLQSESAIGGQPVPPDTVVKGPSRSATDVVGRSRQAKSLTPGVFRSSLIVPCRGHEGRDQSTWLWGAAIISRRFSLASWAAHLSSASASASSVLGASANAAMAT